MEGIVNEKGVSCISCGVFTPWDKAVSTDEGDYCEDCAEHLPQEV
jgi:hypothetical protein